MPISGRGQHPDFDEHGNLFADAFLEPQRRDFNRMMADPAGRQRFMENVTRYQSQLPVEVQREVQGQTYGAGRDAYDGWQLYREAVEQAHRYYRAGEVTSDDVARMTPAEYDRVFDERGQPREGYSFRSTSRDVRTNDSTDPHTRQELRR